MFGPTYFGPRYFGPTYFGTGGAAVVSVTVYQGKYRPEWAGAFLELGAVSDFTAEHGDAFRSLGDA